MVNLWGNLLIFDRLFLCFKAKSVLFDETIAFFGIKIQWLKLSDRLF
jgi:hypothetical protein